ncbi:MAG: TetR/AcrR family transcriptional regulator [Isosphaeraceae bacterium]|nr:TetR/AcrR family transcriptional regulator [Isosphaeraceae bacterium]
MNAEVARTRNPEGTKRAVVDAAERLFAERGFAGTSMRDISEASGVSQPLIQHHFGSKEGLYSSVLRRAVENYAARFPDAARVTDQPVDVQTELERLFQFVRDYPLQTRIVGWARLEGKQGLVTGCEALRCAMVHRIERGQELGLVRNDIDAPSLAVMLEALIFYWFENRPLNAALFPAGLDDDAYVRKAIALLERGFAPGGTGRSAKQSGTARASRKPSRSSRT